MILGFASLLGSLFTPLLVVFFFIGMKTHPERWRKYIWLYVLIIAAVSYNYVPNETGDLTRYYSLLDSFKRLSLKDAIQYDNATLFVQNIYFWIISKTGAYSLLQVFPTVSVYYAAAYITCDLYEKTKSYSLMKKMLVIQFLFLPMVSIINNVRNVGAFALMTLAVYRDMVQHKRNIATIAVYAMSIFFHLAGVTLLLLRIVAVSPKRSRILLGVLFSFTPFFLGMVSRYKYLLQSNHFLYSLASRVDYYFSDSYASSDYATKVSQSAWHGANKITQFLFAGLIITMAVLNNRRRDTGFGENNKLQIGWNNFSFYSVLVGLMILACASFVAPHYWRYAVALTISLAAPFLPALQRNKKTTKVFLLLLLVIALVSFLLQMRRIVGFRYYTLAWAEKTLTKGPLFIMLDVINNIL